MVAAVEMVSLVIGGVFSDWWSRQLVVGLSVTEDHVSGGWSLWWLVVLLVIGGPMCLTCSH